MSSAIRQAVAAQLERLQELVLRVGELVGHVEPLDPLQEALSGAAIGCDLGFELELRQPLGGSSRRPKNSWES